MTPGAIKFYSHPASTVARPVAFFIADAGIVAEEQVIDLFTGAQYGPAFAAVNPNNAVPALEDGDFRLTESSAILKYLADKFSSPAYPRELHARALAAAKAGAEKYLGVLNDHMPGDRRAHPRGADAARGPTCVNV